MIIFRVDITGFNKLAVYIHSYYNLQLWFFREQNQQIKNQRVFKVTYKFGGILFCFRYKLNKTTVSPPSNKKYSYLQEIGNLKMKVMYSCCSKFHFLEAPKFDI